MPSKLLDMLNPGAGVILPGVADALSARISVLAGFDAIFVTGAGIANRFLGAPDIGLVGLTELVDHVRAITAAVSVPVVVDADTGFGNSLNMRRTVQLLETAGASAIIVEDQTFPKRCGHFKDKSVVPIQEMVTKVMAAVDARKTDMAVIARTDARSTEGLASALDRVAAYQAAGADIMFVEAPETVEELAEIPRQVPGRHLCNMVVGGRTPLCERQKLADMGYAAIGYANTALQASMAAMRDALGHLNENGSMTGFVGPLLTFAERQAVLDADAYVDLENRYAI